MSLVELRMVGNAWQMSNTLSLGCVIVLRISLGFRQAGGSNILS